MHEIQKDIYITDHEFSVYNAVGRFAGRGGGGGGGGFKGPRANNMPRARRNFNPALGCLCLTAPTFQHPCNKLFASAGAMQEHSLTMTNCVSSCIILTENCLSLVTETILSAGMIRCKIAAHAKEELICEGRPPLGRQFWGVLRSMQRCNRTIRMQESTIHKNKHTRSY